jgi:glucuronoarabinoxylan endo-1,4-beta-xylanase
MNQKNTRLIIKLLFLGSLYMGSNVLGQTATVDMASGKQLIRGFGGMNHTAFPGDITSAQAEKAFGNGAGQLGFSILRIHVDPNSASFSKELATARIAKSHGAIIFASPWTPPTSMKTNNNQVGGSLKTASYGAYASHLKSFCDYMSTNGVPLYAISVQNEPDITVTYESCDWTSAQMIDFLNNNRDAIGSTKVIAPESFQFKKPFSDAILNDAKAVTKVDIIGAHIYGGGLTDYPLAHQKGKEVWMTEHYTTSDRSANLWPDALEVGKEMHDCMVANYSAYVWWYIRRSYGPIDDNSNVTKRGYVMGQFSKFVRPGFIRVDATAAPVSNVSVSAFKSDSSLVVVLVNKNTSAKSQQITIKSGAVSSFTKYTTSESKNILSDGTVAVSGGTFTVSLDAQSITTLTGQLASVGIHNSGKNDLNKRNKQVHRSDTFGILQTDNVYDLRGNVVRRQCSGSAVSNSNTMGNGVYIVKSGNADGGKFKKMIIGR